MSGRLHQLLLPVVCVLSGTALGQDAPQASPLTTAELFARVNGSVCTIVSVDEDQNLLRRGSGFILKGTRLLVTNAHVLAGFENAEVKCGEQRAAIERITHYDDTIDLVLAQTGAIDVEGLELSARSDIPPGTQVYAFGSPYGLEGTITPGLTSTSRRIMGRRYLQISTPISSGSSGGPVTDGAGTVIGVTVATLEVAQNINFALPVSAIAELPNVDLQPGQLAAAEHRFAPRDPAPIPRSPEMDTDVASAGAAFRGFEFGSPCGDIAIAEYERKLASSRRLGLTRFDNRYAGTLELDVSLLGIPATVFYECDKRLGMVGGHYELLGHRDAVPQIAEEISSKYGAGFPNPISEGEAAALGCRWNDSLPGSYNYRPSLRTTWMVEDRLRIDLLTCGGSSTRTFVFYGDPLLANVVEQTAERPPYEVF